MILNCKDHFNHIYIILILFIWPLLSLLLTVSVVIMAHIKYSHSDLALVLFESWIKTPCGNKPRPFPAGMEVQLRCSSASSLMAGAGCDEGSWLQAATQILPSSPQNLKSGCFCRGFCASRLLCAVRITSYHTYLPPCSLELWYLP